MIVIVMGVMGSGKTTVGKRLAAELNYEFQDADWFHSPENIDKMSRGIPLNDSDRTPWLLRLRDAIALWLEQGKNVVLACSILKHSYRQVLWCDSKQMRLVYLKGSFEQFAARLNQRQNHFMNTNLLQSQLDTLEEPTPLQSIWVEVSQSPDAIVQDIKSHLLGDGLADIQ